MLEKRSNRGIITLKIYTDGSLKKAGQSTTFGGWAYVAIRDCQQIAGDTGSERDTTNQRMELLAIIKGLEYAKEHRQSNEQVIIYSDSAYAINCYLQNWHEKWLANGWVNSNKRPVANQDLWEQIIPFFNNFWYDFRKVAGHAGDTWNEICDYMAQDSAERAKRTWKTT